MVDFINAAPMVVDQGTQDLSARAVTLGPVSLPQHLPKFYIFAEKGPVGPTYVDFDVASLTQIFGTNTFDVNKKYFTHQTPFVQVSAANANNCVVHRVVAPDAKDVANIALYLDVLAINVPVYVKNVDGSLLLDVNGAPTQALDGSGLPITTPGYNVAWVVDKTIATVGAYQPGLLIDRPGLQVNGVTQSTQHPIFEFATTTPGEAGNNVGIRLYPALQTDITPFPSNILIDGKMFPFYFQAIKLIDTLTGKTASSLNSFGAQYTKFVAMDRGVDPASGAVIDLTKTVTDQYISLPASMSSDIGSVHVYSANLTSVLTSLYNAEKVVVDNHRDSVISTTATNIYGINFMSFTSSNSSPYQAIKLVDLPGSVRLTKNTNLFLSGSSDGTISESLLDTLVAADMLNYSDRLHEYNDLVMHPESIIYDSGFTLATKKALANFISVRKDTFVNWATYAHDAPSSTLADQYSVGIALKTMAELYPESATFGTPVMRGTINAGSGVFINSLYTRRVPLTYELAYMSSKFMGAKNGAWKNGFSFDRAPLNIITQLKNIDVTWVPTSTRNTMWSAGINFVLNYRVNTQFFPAIQTIYNDDTSVLNSYFTAVAISYLNKVSHAAWREFSGSVSLTNAQLEEKVNTFVSNEVKDKFDGMFVIRPNATVTAMDNQRGYSWTLPIQIYANNMKSVMTTYVQAYRQSDLQVK